jgi:hypothetical protein
VSLVKGRHIAVIVALTLLGSACATTSGRIASVAPGDKLVTLKVKARLLRTFVPAIAGLEVDTYDRIVYLSGTVKTDAQKRLAEELAGRVKNVALVVNNVAVREAPAESGLASPGVAPRGDERPPLVTKFGKIRLDLVTGTPVWTRYAAFDTDGRQVATVYSILATHLSELGVDSLRKTDRPIDHVSILPTPSSDEYQVVLWHVTPDEADALH